MHRRASDALGNLTFQFFNAVCYSPVEDAGEISRWEVSIARSRSWASECPLEAHCLGRLAAAGSVDAIRAAMDDIPFSVRIRTDSPRQLGATLLSADNVHSVEVETDGLTVLTDDANRLGRDVPRFAATLVIIVSSP